MYNRTLTHALEALGHNPKRHLPHEGIPPRTVNLVDWTGKPWITTEVYVQAKNVAARLGIKQRTRGVCPFCSKEFALGNLRQHLVACW